MHYYPLTLAYTHRQSFYPYRYVSLIISTYVKRPWEAHILKVMRASCASNANNTTCFFSGFPLFWISYAAKADSGGCVGGNYTWHQCCRITTVSYPASAPLSSRPWHWCLLTLVTYWYFSLCRKTWRGIIASAATVEGKQLPRWTGER